MEIPSDTPLGLFDEHGRRIPPPLAAPVNRVSRRYFRLEQPEIDYGAIFERIRRHLGSPAALTRDGFEERAQAILAGLEADPATASIARGVHVPFFLPAGGHADLGEALEKRYVPAVGSAFGEAFPQYRFDNHHQGELAGKLRIQPDSRHDRLLGAMGKADVVGWYFPCLNEYSVPAVQEQMETLPDRFLLAGGYDTCAALVGSPALLQRRQGYPNMLWLAALKAEKEQAGYYFEAYGLNLTFNRRPHFGQVSEYWASALVVLG